VTYNEPNPSAVEHKKISDIKHLHPFKNKVIPFVLHSIFSRPDWQYNYYLLSLHIFAEDRMAGDSENNED
jgi:hypothetical protein